MLAATHHPRAWKLRCTCAGVGLTCLDACSHKACTGRLVLGWKCQGSMLCHKEVLHTGSAIPVHANRCTPQWQRPAEEYAQPSSPGVIRYA